jgi:RNA polymerase sigma-70 factor (ECF subfamily)
VRRLGDVGTRKAQAAFEQDDVDQAVASGDRQRAFTLLMNRYGDQVYRYAVAMTGDGQLAEEVRQQAFVEAYRDLPGFASRSPVRAWLLGIVRHRCLDATKKARRWSLRYKNESSVDHEVDDAELGDQIDRQRMARLLEDCLATLAPAAREAVLLRYHQELSYDEIAVLTGDLPGTLQQRVARALPVLRKCVEARLRPGEDSNEL